ncbi:MAG: hypothetical protein H7245_15075 [Candidatus Saccharibacteria bacterium]|nr:hypothetical protein [Pseudorhodobacter sp.]
MIRFAALCAVLPRDKTALATYRAEAPLLDVTTALALLSGKRPRRIAAPDLILAWVAEARDMPDFLLAACREVTNDRAETAALLLPPPTGTPPTLTEVVQTLTLATPLTARATLTSLWARLPPQANIVLNRLAAGSFRTLLPQAAPLTNQPPRTVKAVMTLVQPAGPEITLALWQDGVPVPITRLPLTLPETPAIMAWVRSHTLEKFGPVRKVPAELVFEMDYTTTTPNKRRKCGLDLHQPRLLRWLPDVPPDQADPLARLTDPSGEDIAI